MKNINLDLRSQSKEINYADFFNNYDAQEAAKHKQLNQDQLINKNSLKEEINSHKQLLSYARNREIIHNNLGVLYQQNNENLKARRHFFCALKINTTYRDALINLANSYALEGDYAVAEKHYQHLHESGSSDPKLMINFGSALVNQGKADKAIKVLEKAISSDPSLGMAHYLLARSYIMKGNANRARELLNHILEKNPNLGSVQRTRADCIKFTRQTPELQELEEAAKRISIDSEDFVHINFALGKAYEDIGDIEKSFKHVKIANNALRKQLQYDWTRDQKKFSSNSRLFNPVYFHRLENTVRGSKQSVVFLVGLPRCGSSLTHQILSMHSQVSAIGESTALVKAILNKRISDLHNPRVLEMIQQEYLEHHGNNQKKIVDKNLYNFFWIPLIKIIFPDAVFINLERDMSGHFWSMFKNYFTYGNEFTTSLQDMYNYTNLYRQMIDQWRIKLGIPIHSFSYDRLVANKEESIRELLELCQLRWEDQCMNFTQSSTTVQTASAIQVRRDIYQSSSTRGRDFDLLLKEELHDHGINI